MLRFKEFRFKEEGGTPNLPASVPPAALAVKTQTTIDAIGKVIDTWAKELKTKILNPMTPPEQRRGLWDRFKNWTSNLWHGRYNQTNPYFWNNKLGDDLGREESYLPIAEYNRVRSIVDNLEFQLNELSAPDMPNLKIVRIIDQSAQELKKVLQQLLSKEIQINQEQPQAEPPVQRPTTAATSMADKQAEEEPEEIKEPEEIIPPAASPVEPIKEPEEKAPEAAPEVEKPILNPQKPPTTGRRWEQLTAEERMAWNHYGGGTANKPSGWLKEQGVSSLPWILRAGDPRHELLANQPRKFWEPLLHSQERIEYYTDPIKSPEELRMRVDKAKQNYEKWHQNVSKIKKSAMDSQQQPRGENDAEAGATVPATRKMAPPPNEKPPVVGPTASGPATTKMQPPPGEQPQNPLSGPNSNLSDPAHKPSKRAAKKQMAAQRKADLAKRIDDLKDILMGAEDDLKARLKKLKPDDEEGFKELEAEIAHDEDFKNRMGDLPVEENILSAGFHRYKMRNWRPQESKFSQMSFAERVASLRKS